MPPDLKKLKEKCKTKAVSKEITDFGHDPTARKDVPRKQCKQESEPVLVAGSYVEAAQFLPIIPKTFSTPCNLGTAKKSATTAARNVNKVFLPITIRATIKTAKKGTFTETMRGTVTAMKATIKAATKETMTETIKGPHLPRSRRECARE